MLARCQTLTLTLFTTAALLLTSACATHPQAPTFARTPASAPRVATPGDDDGDGLSDYAETHKYGSDPARIDTAYDGVSDATWDRRREFTYTITTLFRVLKPGNPADMSDDYQDARVVLQDADSYTVEVVHYPLNTNADAVGENPNWRRDVASMTEYLEPTPTANWDEAMHRDLVAALRADGIDPDALTDRELVRRVSRWAMRHSTTNDLFGLWLVSLDGGTPHVPAALREAFDARKSDPSWSDEDMFARELLGREMFQRREHGTCTSSSVYLTTILRALGIPTRIAIFTPAADPNDERQVDDLVSHIRHNDTRSAVKAGLHRLTRTDQPTLANHLMNEVFVGGRWVRLNYAHLGQNIVDPTYYGLMTHVATVRDLGDLHLADTWGKRYASRTNASPRLSSINPYMMLTASDHFGTRGSVGRTALLESTLPETQRAASRLTGFTLVRGDYPQSCALPRVPTRTRRRGSALPRCAQDRLTVAADFRGNSR